MKHLLPFFVLANPLSAQIYADVSTTLGEFSIELYYEDSPKTVANLMTLAEGTRPWIDSTTGQVKKDTPYFDGIIFHRVIDGFMNQAGSPNGTGSDGPGYLFPDEVDNGLLHDEPYLLSSANAGPHSNGSQFFTTVGATPWLDGIHTVFGKIVTGTDTIEAINNTPVNISTPITPVVINSMRIRRVGAEAEAFDEFAQGLPEVSAATAGVIPPSEAEPAMLSLTQPAGTTLQVASSSDLKLWGFEERYLGAGESPLSDFKSGQSGGKGFFATSLVTWPAEAKFPTSLLGEEIILPTDLGTFTLVLTDPGEIRIEQSNGSTSTGEIDYETSTFENDGYGASLLIYSDTLVPVRFRLGADLPVGSPLTGRVSGTAFTASQSSFSGTFSVAP